MYLSEEIQNAITSVQLPVIRQALKDGALTINGRFYRRNFTIWHVAVMKNDECNLILLRELLQKYINDNNCYLLNLTDEHGLTPLHWAAKSKNLGAIRYLIYFGADPTIPMPCGKTMQHIIENIAGRDLSEEVQNILADYKKGIKPMIYHDELKYLKDEPVVVNQPTNKLKSSILNCFATKFSSLGYKKLENKELLLKAPSGGAIPKSKYN